MLWLPLRTWGQEAGQLFPFSHANTWPLRLGVQGTPLADSMRSRNRSRTSKSLLFWVMYATREFTCQEDWGFSSHCVHWEDINRVCVCVREYACVKARGQFGDSLLQSHFILFFETGFLMEIRAHWVAGLAVQQPPGSCCLHSLGLRLKMCSKAHYDMCSVVANLCHNYFSNCSPWFHTYVYGGHTSLPLHATSPSLPLFLPSFSWISWG